MPTTIWHTRPVFITSTFRDMHAERDHLHNFVFPSLEERLRERYHHLEPIDLRWGVETVGVDEQHAKEMLVLKVCLNEIKRSRPFLIALLGDRYGWIPSEERMTLAAKEAGYREELAGHSVTALEIEYGVLNSDDQQKRSFFYFRNPLPCHEMDAETAAIYSDNYSPDHEGRQAHQRLVDLKARIEREHPERVRHYQTEWDKEKSCVTGLGDWGKLVLEDLWNELDAETANLAKSAEVSWEQQERWVLESFIESRSRDFVGRQSLLDDLISLATSEALIGAEWGACITGPAGGGKSSLIAQLSKTLQNDDTILLSHSAGISPRSIQIESLLRRWVDELTQSIGIKNPLTDQTTAEELEKTFHEMLGRGAAKKRVIILIDALNQFENSPQAKHLTWLPKHLPTNSRLIATAIPCSASETLQGKQGVQTISLQPLEQTDADSIIKKICHRYHRELNPIVQQILLDKKDSSNQPASGNPLWLTLALEELNLLDADDFARAEKQYSGTGEEKLLKMLIDTAEQLPGDVDDLYGWLLNRAEEVHGREWTEAFVNLITVSRTGWRESDLKALMPIASNCKWSDLNFATLRRGFRAHVTQKGSYGQWDFSHAQMRIAVLERNLSDKEITKQLHTTIVDYLLSLPSSDQLHESETMVHLIAADDKIRTVHYYGTELTDGEAVCAAQALAEFLLSGGQDEYGPEVSWVCELLNTAVDNEERALTVCSRNIYSLNDILQNLALSRTRLAILMNTMQTLQKIHISGHNTEKCLLLQFTLFSKIGDISYDIGIPDIYKLSYNEGHKIIEQLVLNDKNNKEYQRFLSVSCNKMGDILLRSDLDKAREWYSKGLSISESLITYNNCDSITLHDFSVSLDRIGEIEFYLKNFESAKTIYEKAISIREILVDQCANNPLFLIDLSGVYNMLGDIMFAQGAENAIDWYQKGLAIREKLVDLYPDNRMYLRALSISLSKIGSIVILSSPDYASEVFIRGLKISEELCVFDPENSEYIYDRYIFLNKIGSINLLQNQKYANDLFSQGLKLINGLISKEPDNVHYNRYLYTSYLSLIMATNPREHNNLIELFDDAIKIAKELANKTEALLELSSLLTVRINLIKQSCNFIVIKDLHERIVGIHQLLVAENPDSFLFNHELSLSLYNFGDFIRTQERNAALQWYLKYIELTETILVMGLNNIDMLSKHLQLLNKVGNLYRRTSREIARRFYLVGINIAEILVTCSPNNTRFQYDLSSSFNKLGNIDNKSEYFSAKHWYLKGLKIREMLVDQDPNNTDFLSGVIRTLNCLGNLDGQRNPNEAQKWYMKGLEFCEKLVALEPDNTEYLQDLLYIYQSLLSLESTDQVSNRALCDIGISVADKLAEKVNDNEEKQFQLSHWLNRRGGLVDAGSQGEARGYYEKAFSIRRKLADDFPGNAMYWGYAASSLSMIAETYLQQGMLEKELEYSLQAAEVMNRAAELNPDDADTQYGLACTSARLGETDKALAALARSIELGNTGADHAAQDADLISLRGLPEFEALLERMRQALE